MYRGKRLAVVFRAGGVVRVVCGRVASGEDRDLGPIFEVALEQDGHDLTSQTTLIFQKEWLQGRVDVDNSYGCDLSVDLGCMMQRSDLLKRV